MSLAALGAGKAAVAAAFSPSDIAGLQVWLKDTGLAGADDDRTNWTNEGVGTATFTETGDARPLKKTGILNGRAVARFSGAQQLVGGDLSALFPAAATMFVVFAPVEGSFLYTLYTAGTTESFWRFSNGQGYLGVFRPARIDGYPAAPPEHGTHRQCVVSSASTYETWIDGVSEGAQSANFTGGTNHVIGNGAAPLQGDLAEILIYDSALSVGNRNAVDAYLVSRFAL